MARVGEDLCVVAVGERSGSATAIALPNVPGRFATIRAKFDNAGNVWVGRSSAVTVGDGTTDTTSGYPLDAGEAITLPIKDNLNEIYIICDNASDDVHYLVEGLVSQS